MEKEVGFPICDGWVDFDVLFNLLVGNLKMKGLEMLGQTFNSMKQLVDMKIVSSIRPGSSQIIPKDVWVTEKWWEFMEGVMEAS